MIALARRCRLAALLLLLALAPAATAAAQGDAAPQGQPAIDEDKLGELVMGSMLFIFFHELGHAYIDQLKLPAVGPEEDVADEFAIFILVAVAKEGAEFGHSALIAAAESWRLMWLEVEPLMRETPDKFPFWDEHNLDIKRFYNIVCLLYGSDPGAFWPLATQTGIPVERARKCEDEYKQKWEAWQNLMEPHAVPEGTPPPPDMREFKVTYGSADDDFARQMQQVFQQEQMWERLVVPLGQNIIMPNDIDVFVRSCGEANAWWDPEQRSITLCYEMVHFVSQLFVKAAQAELAANQAPPGQPPAGPQPQPDPQVPQPQVPQPQPQVPQPQPQQTGGQVPQPVGPLPAGPPPFGPQQPGGPTQPAGQTQPGGQVQPPILQTGPLPMIDQRLVGVWQAQMNAGGASSVTRLSLNQDGTFLQMSYGTNSAPFYLWGSYMVERSRIKFTVAGWQPQQICNTQGCSPVRMTQQEYAPFQLMGPTTMQLRQSLFYRIQ